MTPNKQTIVRILLGLGTVVFLGIATARGQTYSQARVVRLSFVEGNVTVQRPDIGEWAEAPMNTPIQEGFKLSTAEGGFAEVEFENGSTVRLGQLSLLEFTQLALASDGSKINRLTLTMGYATFHATPEGQDVYEVLTSNGTVTPRGKALFRVDVDSTDERVEVFNGFVDVASSLGSWALSKNSVLDLSPAADQPTQLSEGITKDDWDRWVEERENQEEAASNTLSPSAYTNNASDDVYGWSDLAYYGNWSYMSGFGYGWIPSVNTGWYPFSLGRWCWYPGFGYTWISADPWGWLPYHFGGWEFIPGIGWVWFPGNFGVWSPGLVTWYGGPGWIGWRPRHGLPRPVNVNPCPQGQPCGTAVSASTFKNGRPVGPGTILSVNLESGNRMERPGVLPDRQAMLPGRVVAPPVRYGNPKMNIVGTRRATLSSETMKTGSATPAPRSVAGITLILGGPAVGSPSRHATPGPESGIVYDAQAGRYVNNSHLSTGVTQSPSEMSAGALTSAGASGSSAVQTPQGRLRGAPAPAPQSQGSAWSHHSSPRSDSGSAAAPRSGGATSSGKATGGSGSSSGGSRSGPAGSGGGGTGGGAHANAGSSGGSHH